MPNLESPTTKKVLPKIWLKHLARADCKKYQQQLEGVGEKLAKRATFNPFEGISDEFLF